MFSLAVLVFASVVCGALAAPSGSPLPKVDLGYQIHQAISINESTQIYNFSNIRYAQPPVGKLRWAAPLAPTGRNTQVQNGSVGRICPQASPAWTAIGLEFSLAWAEGKGSTFNYTAAAAALAAQANASTSKPDPRINEDCLFLDVFVPKGVFNNKTKNGKGGAPVLVWIYGGGYTSGSKSSSGSPEGLIAASQATGGSGIVFVEMNYRLGALGWLAGPSLHAAGGVSNAALYDQRLAIKWANKYIHLFGGDPGKITIMGESAGAGSVMHQITAYGGQRTSLFQQAVLQSPGWFPLNSSVTQENTTQTFLKILGASSIAEARNMSSEAVTTANQKQILVAPYGQYFYGPAVDGSFVPAQPPQLLTEGAFAKNVKIMVGHNAEEGVYFTDPRVKTDAQLTALLIRSYPNITSSAINEIVNVLYPAVYNGTYPYTTPIDRTILILSEAAFACNTNYLDRAYGNKSYAYEFEVPPALHAQDVPSTFYNGEGSVASEGLIAPVALALQAYITNFVTTGNPNGVQPGLPRFPIYGMNSSEMGLNYTGIKPQTDPTANGRCAWWEKGLYY